MAAPAAGAFDAQRGWRLHPQVALRHEEFGALAYHYGNRRLVFLKSPRLVSLVTALEAHDTATGALEATVPATEHDRYRRALARLAASEVIDAR